MPSQQRPVIGLTSSLTKNSNGTSVCQVGQAYISAIQNAEGIPMVIPVLSTQADLHTLLAKIDGVMFTGGGDIDPKQYDGNTHAKVYSISKERDALEFALMDAALKANKPVLAICRGIQVLNVSFGGDLYSHIQDQLENSLKHDWFPKFPRDKLAHTVQILPGSHLHKIFGTEEIKVNSLHHQGIKRIGSGLTATAFAPDELVEGLEVQDADFVIGVQWHPECLPEENKMKMLFEAFINACVE